MNFINCTPHRIVLQTISKQINFEASGIIPRVETNYSEVEVIEDIPFVSVKKGKVVGLPDCKDNTVYIVSGLVFDTVSSFRIDVIAPDTGETAIRNEKGQIVAVTRFLRK